MANLVYLSCRAFWALQSGVGGSALEISRLPRAWGVLQSTPAGGTLFGCARSLTIQELESQSIISPCAFPAKFTPVKSALEWSRAGICGTYYLAYFPLRAR